MLLGHKDKTFLYSEKIIWVAQAQKYLHTKYLIDKMKILYFILASSFLVTFFFFFLKKEEEKKTANDSIIIGPSKKDNLVPNIRPNEIGGISVKGENEDRVFPVDFNPDADRIPTNLKILEKIDPNLLEKISESMEVTKSRSRHESDSVVDNWMKGREKISFAFQNSPNQRPVVGYFGDKHFFYADFNHPDFSKGYAVSKKTGDVYVWDLSK